MTTVCRNYGDDEEARRAVDRVLAAGVAAGDVRLVMGEERRDGRHQPHGSYAGGAGGPGAPIGSYAAGPVSPRAGMGDFAGDAERRRQGGFGDVDRDTVTTYGSAGVERVHVASHGELKRLLLAAGLDGPAADRDVAAVHDGRILVLVETADAAAGDLEAALDAA